MKSIAAFIAASIFEIAGCFAFWGWMRLGYSSFWLIPGCALLVIFAYLLPLAETESAGRAYAIYGGIYIAASLSWLWAVEGIRPDKWDTIGSIICILGALIILYGPRTVSS